MGEERGKNVICPLCQEEGKRIEMQERRFAERPLAEFADRFPGAFVKLHNPATRKFDLEIFAATNLQVNWKCPECNFQASE